MACTDGEPGSGRRALMACAERAFPPSQLKAWRARRGRTLPKQMNGADRQVRAGSAKWLQDPGGAGCESRLSFPAERLKADRTACWGAENGFVGDGRWPSVRRVRGLLLACMARSWSAADPVFRSSGTRCSPRRDLLLMPAAVLKRGGWGGGSGLAAGKILG